MRPYLLAVGLIATAPQLLPAQSASFATGDFKRIADSVAGTGGAFERTARLVHWLNASFTWSATDYVRRTPAEIVARRQGNCAELSLVLRSLLDSLGVRSRWIREINVQPGQTPKRQATAAEMVANRGNLGSVFGLQHNDHVWLEVRDERDGSWFPADPAYGVVGLKEWVPALLAMSERPKPRVAAVVPIAADMVVPFVVLSQERRNTTFENDRTEYYLIEQFAALYNGRLSALPAWPEWTAAVRALSPRARGAFENRENLHAHTEAIGQLKAVYDRLTAQAVAKGLKPAVR